MVEHRYFLFDPDGEGFETFETRAEQMAAAEKAITFYGAAYDDWTWWEVENILCGTITEQATACNVKRRPDASKLDENGFDEDENNWGAGIEAICDYKMMPIKDGREG